MSLRLVSERRAGLLAYVDGLPRAHDLIVQSIGLLDGKRCRWVQTRRRLENMLEFLNHATSRERLHFLASELRALTLWMPSSEVRLLLMEAGFLMLSAPDYTRVICEYGKVRPWPATVG